METIINKKKLKLNMYKKLSILIFSMLFLFSNVSALQLAIDDNGLLPVDKTIFTNVIYTFDGTNVDSNNNIDVLRNTIFQTPAKTLITSSIKNNDNIPHEFRYTAVSLTGGVIINSENVNISPNIQRDFIVITTFKNEEVDIYFKCLDCVNNSAGNYAYNYQLLEKTEKGTILDITSVFVSAMKDLIDIQIGFWKLIYYLFIFAIILGGITLLIGFGFTIYDWAEKLSDKKKEIWHGGKK